MRGDSEYANQHQHGVKESARPATGAHLMSRDKPEVPKEIRRVSTSFRGHLLLTFTDGTTHELQRGDYPHNIPPKPGDFYPPIEAARSEPGEPPEASLASRQKRAWRAKKSNAKP